MKYHRSLEHLLRASLALYSYDVSRHDLACEFGLDLSKPFLVQQHKIPPTERTLRRIARLAGVSEKWMLSGHPVNERDFTLERYIPQSPRIVGSGVIQGNAENIIVHVRNN